MTHSFPSRIYWPAFFLFLFVPLFGSAVFPLLFGSIVPLTGVIFYLGHGAIFKTWPVIKTPFKGLLPLALSLIALMAASYFWSVNPDASIERTMKLAGLILACFGVVAVAQACPDEQWQKYKLFFPLGVFIIGAVCAVEFAFDMPLYRFINGDTVDVRPDLMNKNVAVFVMALPVAFYLSWKSRSILFFCGLVTLMGLLMVLTRSQAAQLGLLIMLIASFGCLSFLETLTIRTAFMGLAFLFIMMPWISPTLFDLLAAKVSGDDGLLAAASTALRLENWDFLARRIMENPLTGFGLDSTRYMVFDTEQLYFHNDHIMHPHNAPLQMWIEFGVLGCIWALAFLGFFYAMLTRLPSLGRRLGFIVFVTIMVFLLVAWSLWASWLVGLILYLAALTVLAAKTSNGLSNS